MSPIELIITGPIQDILAMHPSKSHPNPSPSTDVIKRFQLKEHLYTFESLPKRNPPQIEFIFTGLSHNTLAVHPSKSYPHPSPYVRVTSDFQLKEHLYTFELPPKRIMSPIELIFTGQVVHIVHMSPIKSHPNPMTLV